MGALRGTRWHLDGKPISGNGEWILHDAKIPVGQYKELATQFNPTKFDADAWVTLAKNAGMKYIVITAKHHDGFAMFESKADGFNIVDATPFKRRSAEGTRRRLRRQGMKLGFYYSQNLDWTAPGGGNTKMGPGRGAERRFRAGTWRRRRFRNWKNC